MDKKGLIYQILAFAAFSFAISFYFGAKKTNVYVDKKDYIIQEKRYEDYFPKVKTKERVLFIKHHILRVSHYTLSVLETDNTPNILSCGKKENIKLKENEHIIAISQDLFFDRHGRKHLCGKYAKVFVKDKKRKVYKVYYGIIYDTMNPRYRKSVDVLVDSRKSALELGVYENATILIFK